MQPWRFVSQFCSPLFDCHDHMIFTCVFTESQNSGMVDWTNCSCGFYTPSIPNEWFNPMNLRHENITQISIIQSEYVFQLPVTCFGNKMSVQVCLIIKRGTKGKIIKFSSSRQITFKWNKIQMNGNCENYNGFFICCPILCISKVFRLMNPMVISIELLQPIDLVRFVHSNFTTTFGLCNVSNGSSECSCSDTFPIIFMIRKGKNIKLS